MAQPANGIIKQHALKEGERIPANLVSAAGSGVDPHISLQAACFQLPRIWAARHIREDQLESLIRSNVEAPALFMFGGDQVVNVLEPNLASDKIAIKERQ